MKTFGLAIAGLGAEFRSPSPGLLALLRRRYGRFAASGRGLKLELSPRRPSSGGFTPRVKADKSSLTIDRGDLRAVLDLRSGRGRVEAAPSEQCLDAFLRAYISASLLRSGGLMLHSAGILMDGRACLFPGVSGAGKSTLGRLAAASGRAELISDEINLLRFERGRLMVYGSPFWGEMRADGRPGRWPLGGIFALKKARADSLSPLGRAELLRLLLRCTVNFEKSPEAASLALANAAAIAAYAPAGRLAFCKSGCGFLELI